MRRRELARALAEVCVAEARHSAARQVVDAHAGAQVGVVCVHAQTRQQLTNVGQVSRDVESAGAVQIVPLAQVTALPVE